MRPYRNLKIASVIEHELGNLLIREFDFENAIVTIVGVEVSPDLMQAKIKLGIIPFEKSPEIFKLIEEKRRELQHKLLKKMNIRPMPRLKFVLRQAQDTPE